GVPEQGAQPARVRDFVPMRVGSATVFVEAIGETELATPADEIYTVAPVSPQEAFRIASEFLQECVLLVGERVEGLTENRPSEVSIEFSLTFQVKGKASIIPVFVTSEAGAQTGLKVKAVWKIADKQSDEGRVRNG